MCERVCSPSEKSPFACFCIHFEPWSESWDWIPKALIYRDDLEFVILLLHLLSAGITDVHQHIFFFQALGIEFRASRVVGMYSTNKAHLFCFLSEEIEVYIVSTICKSVTNRNNFALSVDLPVAAWSLQLPHHSSWTSDLHWYLVRVWLATVYASSYPFITGTSGKRKASCAFLQRSGRAETCHPVLGLATLVI